VNPLAAVAGVFEVLESEQLLFLGTCFAYGRTTTFLTAKHCVDRGHPMALLVCSPRDNRNRVVRRALVHPQADLAILTTDEMTSSSRFIP
jgi:hypothetical protein